MFIAHKIIIVGNFRIHVYKSYNLLLDPISFFKDDNNPTLFFNLVLTYAKESEHLAVFVFFFSDHLLIILTFLIMHYMLENKFSTLVLLNFKKASFLVIFCHLLTLTLAEVLLMLLIMLCPCMM